MKIKLDESFVFSAVTGNTIGDYVIAQCARQQGEQGMVTVIHVVDLKETPDLALSKFDLSGAAEELWLRIAAENAEEVVTDAIIFGLVGESLVWAEIGMPTLSANAPDFRDQFQEWTEEGARPIPPDFEPRIGTGKQSRTYFKLP